MENKNLPEYNLPDFPPEVLEKLKIMAANYPSLKGNYSETNIYKLMESTKVHSTNYDLFQRYKKRGSLSLFGVTVVGFLGSAVTLAGETLNQFQSKEWSSGMLSTSIIGLGCLAYFKYIDKKEDYYREKAKQEVPYYEFIG